MKKLDYARREKVRLCVIHQALHQAGLTRFGADGFFAHDDVMDDAGFHGISKDSIRWDYLREWWQEVVGFELVPLSKEWFMSVRARKAKGIPPPEIAPQKYVAIGNGKATVGYASVALCEGKLAICKFQQKVAVATGTQNAVEKYQKMLTTHDLLPPPPGNNGILPVIEAPDAV